MRKLLLPILLGILSLGVNAQIFNAGFEDNNGPITEWTNINADQNPVEDWMPVPEFNDEAWVQFYDFYDNKIAFSTSFYMNGQPANDWLISPQISIPAGGEPTLYWKAKSYDSTAQDTYAVKVSTTDANMDSFTDLLVIQWEQAYEFNERTLDLSAYADQDIYLAFVNETNGGYFLALDDVYISETSDCYAPSVDTFSSMIDANSYLSNPDSETISFDVSWENLDNVQWYDVGVTTFDTDVSSDEVTENNGKSYTGMQLETRYQMFVKNADCGSGWMGPKSIFTPSKLPYMHGFEPTTENYGEYDSDGWTSDSWIMGINNDLAYEGEGYIFSNTSTTVTANKWLYSYPIVIDENEPIQVNFMAGFTNGATDTGVLKVGITTSNEAGTYPTDFETFNITPGFNTIQHTFDTHASGIVYIAFGNITPSTSENYALRIDNVEINKGTMSVKDTEMQSDINIYPNPFIGKLNIKSKELISGYKVFDLNGKLIISNNIAPKHSLIAEVENLPSGTYVMQIITENNTIYKKIIKE